MKGNKSSISGGSGGKKHVTDLNEDKWRLSLSNIPTFNLQFKWTKSKSVTSGHLSKITETLLIFPLSGSNNSTGKDSK